MTQTLSVTKAQENLAELVKKATKQSDEYFITGSGKERAVLLSADKYESLVETLEIMSDPELMQAIREGEADIAAGRVYDWEDVKKELGLVKEKNVHHNTHKQSKKRT